MIRSIRQFFEQKILSSSASAEDDGDHALNLATAALFIEVVRSDFQVKEEEKRAVEASLGQLLDLSNDETAELIQLAEQEADESVSLFEFTSLVHNNFSPEKKARMMELLWRVAFADGRLDHHEEHLMRKIQRLLHVPQKDYIATKLRARDST